MIAIKYDSWFGFGSARCGSPSFRSVSFFGCTADMESLEMENQNQWIHACTHSQHHHQQTIFESTYIQTYKLLLHDCVSGITQERESENMQRSQHRPMRRHPLLRLLLFVVWVALTRVDMVQGRLGALQLFSSPNGVVEQTDTANEYDEEQPPLSGDDAAKNEHQFIVRFDEDAEDLLDDDAVERKALEAAQLLGGTVRYVFRHIFKGAAIVQANSASAFAAQNDNANNNNNENANLLDNTGDLPFRVEQDLSTQGGAVFDSDSDQNHNKNNMHIQNSAPRQLDRLNQRSLPLDGNYDYAYDGAGVTVFIFDTGIRASHVELAAVNVTCGFNAVAHEEASCDDLGGHGTHVAGSVASTTYGVAKRVQLVSVKVLNRYGNGAYSGVLAGLEYVIQQKQANPDRPMVINMSLGGSRSDAINDAIHTAVTQYGIVVVVAAGNAESDACLSSPSSASEAITVGAAQAASAGGILSQWLFFFLPKRDRRAAYSNYGPCVDLFAWGTSVSSLGIANDKDVTVKSGTSMAAPYVAGAAALYLHRNPSWTPEQVRTAMMDDASTETLMRPYQQDSPNRMINTQNIL